MGILHPDQRTYPATATRAPHTGTVGSTAGGAGYSGNPGVAAGTLIPATQTTATGPAPNTAGPHRHDILNKLDPSVDSDLSKASTAAAGTAGTARTGYTNTGYNQSHSHNPNHNPNHNHNHNHNRQQPVPVTGASRATGPAPNTAGPHSSDMANHLDPTVDSRTGLRK